MTQETPPPPAPRLIPLDQIDELALPRDRSMISADGLRELELSIARDGLRTPVEVFETDKGFGLISGYRRVIALRRLFEQTGKPEFQSIPAVVRSPENTAEAMALMVAENDIRQDLSAWERSAIVHAATTLDHFETLDAAIAVLYPDADPRKRRRIREIADVVEELSYLLIDPETLSQNRLIRIAAALRSGWGKLLVAALTESGAKTYAEQWQAIVPLLDEYDRLSDADKGRPDTPPRLCEVRVRQSHLIVRREHTSTGYTLHISGPAAREAVVRDVIDQLEYMLGPG